MMEIRVVVKGVRFVGARTAWRHPIGRQAPHQRCVVSNSRKTLFFIFSRNRNRPALGLYRQALGSWFWALGATVFLVRAVFVKLHFPVR